MRIPIKGVQIDQIKSKEFIIKRFWPILVIIVTILFVIALLYFRPIKNSHNISSNNATYSETFAIYGDSRTGNDIHRKIAKQITDLNPKFVFHVGDMVNDGNNVSEWVIFNEITKPFFNKLYPALGNHELNSQLYYNNFNLPNNERWYSVQSDFVYFIVLDSNISFDADSEQVKWLKTELVSAKKSNKFIVILFHHAPFSSSIHGQDKDVLKLGTDLIPILEANNVSLSFNGHDHVYERSYKNGIYYITVGSSGAPLYPQKFSNQYSQKFISDYSFAKMIATKSELQVNIENATGAELDRINIVKSKL